METILQFLNVNIVFTLLLFVPEDPLSSTFASTSGMKGTQTWVTVLVIFGIIVMVFCYGWAAWNMYRRLRHSQIEPEDKLMAIEIPTVVWAFDGEMQSSMSLS